MFYLLAGMSRFLILNKRPAEVSNCLKKSNCDFSILPVRSVGVQGDQRTYTSPVALINTPRDWDWLEKEATRLTNEVRNINRVVLQLDSNNKDLNHTIYNSWSFLQQKETGFAERGRFYGNTDAERKWFDGKYISTAGNFAANI